jgi:integrase
MEVALEYERLVRGGETPTIAALMKLGKDLMKRMGERVDDCTIEEEFGGYLGTIGGKSESTRERYEQIVREFLAFLGKRKESMLTALTAADIEGYKTARLKKGLSGKSMNFELKFLRSVLKRAMVAQRILGNPALQVGFEQEHSASREDFTPSQVTALLRACKGFKKEKGADWYGVVLTAYYTGARLSDAANLRSGNMQLDADRPILEYTEKKKRNSAKVKRYLHEELAEYLLTLPSSDDPKSYLFPKLAERVTGGAHGLSSEFIELMDAAGIERRVIREGKRKIYNLSEHSLRHACVSQLQAAGVPEDLRMQIVGHESKAVARNYAHSREAAAKGVALIPKVRPQAP